jgi:hypothetical protein
MGTALNKGMTRLAQGIRDVSAFPNASCSYALAQTTNGSSLVDLLFDKLKGDLKCWPVLLLVKAGGAGNE